MERKKINDRQKRRLFDLMARNYNTLFGRFKAVNGAQIKASLWIKIQVDLNAMGTEKTVEQWKNCWRDLKKMAKLKLMQIRQYKTRTGGGPPCSIQLTDQDQIIISICNLEALDGLKGQELGIRQTPPRDPVPSFRDVHGLSSTNNNSFFDLPSSPIESRYESYDTRSSISGEVDSSKTSSEITILDISSESEVSRKSFERRRLAFHATKTSLTRECLEGEATLNQSKCSISLSSLRGHPWSQFTEILCNRSQSPDVAQKSVSKNQIEQYAPRSESISVISTSDQSVTSSYNGILNYQQRSPIRASATRFGYNDWSRASSVNSELSSSTRITHRCSTPLLSSSITKNRISNRRSPSRASSPARKSVSITKTRISHCHSPSSVSSNARNSALSTPPRQHHRNTTSSSSRNSSSVRTIALSTLPRHHHRNTTNSSSRTSSSVRTTALSTPPRHHHHNTTNSSSRASSSVRTIALSTLPRHHHLNTTNSSSRTSSSVRTSALSTPPRHHHHNTTNSSSRASSSVRTIALSTLPRHHHLNTTNSSSRTSSSVRTSALSTPPRHHHHNTTNSSSRTSSSVRTSALNASTQNSRCCTSCSFSRSSIARDSAPSTSHRSSQSHSSSTRVDQRHHRSCTNASRSSRRSESSITPTGISLQTTSIRRARPNHMGSVFGSVSQSSCRSVGEFSNRNPSPQSRRNLTGTLAKSVQNAASIQRNIERNILSLRDGQEDVVQILEDCLHELRRRNLKN